LSFGHAAQRRRVTRQFDLFAGITYLSSAYGCMSMRRIAVRHSNKPDAVGIPSPPIVLS